MSEGGYFIEVYETPQEVDGIVDTPPQPTLVEIGGYDTIELVATGMQGPKGDRGEDGFIGEDGFSASEVLPYSIGGVVAPMTGNLRLYANRDCTIETVRASIGTPPTGSAVIVDIHKNGTTIFTTQANRPTLVPGVNTVVATPDVTDLLEGDYLTIDLDQVGSTTPGSDLTVQVVAL